MLQVKAPLYIHGMGHFHPDTEIDNSFFESLGIGTNNQWIVDRVGIQTRRTVLPLSYIRETHNADLSQALKVSTYSNAQTGKFAATAALKQAGIDASQIGLVIAGGCSPEMCIPAEAALIAQELGIEATCFDLNSACSSFGAILHFLCSMSVEALPDYILVVLPENNTRRVDYRDRGTAVLWGDGTAAAVVSRKISKPSHQGSTISTMMKVVGSAIASSPAGSGHVTIPAFGHFRQNGSAVQSFAIKRSLELIHALKPLSRGNPSDIYFIGHQANLTMLSSVVRRAEMREDRHFHNVEFYGNCGAAGAPSVLSENWDRFKIGDEIILAVVGSGLTWAGLFLTLEAAPL